MQKKVELTIASSDKFLRRMLWSPYIQGVTEMKVNFSDRKVFEKVSAEVNLLIGWEIISQGATSCTIKSVATALENDLGAVIERLFSSTASMMEEMLAAIKAKQYGQLDSLGMLEETNNKLTYFSLRLLMERGYSEPAKTPAVYFIVLLVEQIVDELRDICGYLVESKLQPRDSALHLFRETLHCFEQSHVLFKEFSPEAFFSHNTKVKELGKRIEQELEKPSKDGPVLARLHSALNMIWHISKEFH